MKAEKSRPAGGQAATQNNAQRKSTPTTRVYVARLGSPEWEELPAADPRRFAAVVRAAEAWRRDGTPEAIAARLRAELDDADLLKRHRNELLEGVRT